MPYIVDKKKRKKLAEALILFSPWKRLRVQMAMASHDIDDYFDVADDILDTSGKTVADALATARPIRDAMNKLIRSSLISGYQDGAHYLGTQVPRSWLNRADKIAANRSAQVQKLMRATTKKRLKSNIDDSYVLSRDRADLAVRYEAANHYFQGLTKSLTGVGMQKAWLTTSDNPCEICIDNEDFGPIPMEDEFPSGDAAPLAHPRCQCVLQVIPLR